MAGNEQDDSVARHVRAVADEGDVTALLRLWLRPDARDEVCRLLFPELRRIAAAKMHGEKRDCVAQPTWLVNEAIMRLLGSSKQWKWENRAHFKGIIATIMRNILVDHARRKKAGKRLPDENKMPLRDDECVCVDDAHVRMEKAEEVLIVHECLEELERAHRDTATFLVLHYFGQLSAAEIAESAQSDGNHDVTAQQVLQHLKLARAWIRERYRDRLI